MVIVFKYLVPRGYIGITIFPFIFLKFKSLKSNLELLNHERIHLRQQLELLIVIFYLWYFLEFLLKLWFYKTWKLAYQNISFEREAYSNEKDLNYLKSRPFYNYIKFL